MRLVFAAILAVLGSSLLLLGMTIDQGRRHVVASAKAVQSDWDQLAGQLQRRYELVGAYAAKLQGLNALEGKIAADTVSSINHFRAAETVSTKADLASNVESELELLLVVVGRHPELRDTSLFHNLQRQVLAEGSELAALRQRYNTAVRQLNGFIRPIPGSFYAALCGIEPGKYFKMKEAAEKAATQRQTANAPVCPTTRKCVSRRSVFDGKRRAA